MGRHSIPDPDEPDELPDDVVFEPEADSYGRHGGAHHRAGPEDEPGYGADGGYDEAPSRDSAPGAGRGSDAEPERSSSYPSYQGDSYATDIHQRVGEDGYPLAGSDEYGDHGDEYGDDFNDDYEDDYTDAYDDGVDDAVDDYGDPRYDHGDTDTRTLTTAGGSESPQVSGGHRNDGEWTGTHRIVTPQGRRGVSVGVIAALVTVVVVVAAFILWKFFGDALSDRSDVAAAQCLQGETNIGVVADAALAEPLSELATKFNETSGPVGDHCPVVTVTAASSNDVIAGLTGEWSDQLGAKPALWIPGSSVSQARLEAAAGPQVVEAARPLVTSPVLIAIPPQLKSALQQQNWGTLPGLQSDPESLNKLDLPGWGSLRLALPTSGNSDASFLAAEAVGTAAAPPGAPADAGVGAVSTLVSAAPELADDSLDTAMKALLDGDDPAAAPVHAVVTTEQQAIKRAGDLSDAKSTLATWIPPGPVAVADFPAVLLDGDWLDDPQMAAASSFERFLRQPEQSAALSEAGFRVEGSDPPTSDVTDGAAVEQTLNITDAGVRVALANAVGDPVAAPAAAASDAAVSIMLDKSLNLPPVVEALTRRIDALPPSAAVGLTVFDSAAGTTLVNLGGLSDDVDGQPRRTAITSALAGLSPAGGAVSFTTLRNVYGDALERFTPGHTNRVLVITSGPHTDRTLDAQGLQDLIRSSVDPARPVAVDVINVGNDPDRATWESVAQISGGTYTSVPASDSPEMTAAIDTMLK